MCAIITTSHYLLLTQHLLKIHVWRGTKAIGRHGQDCEILLKHLSLSIVSFLSWVRIPAHTEDFRLVATANKLVRALGANHPSTAGIPDPWPAAATGQGVGGLYLRQVCAWTQSLKGWWHLLTPD